MHAVIVCVTILCLLRDGVARAAVVAACACIATLPAHDLLCCWGCRCGHTPRSWYFAAYNTGVVIARNTPNAITVGGEGAHCGTWGMQGSWVKVWRSCQGICCNHSAAQALHTAATLCMCRWLAQCCDISAWLELMAAG